MRLRSLVPTLAVTVMLVACGDGGPFQNAVDSTTTTAVVTTETTVTNSDDTALATTEPTADLEAAGVDFGMLDLPPGDPYQDYEQVVDVTGTVEMEVPTAWSDVNPRGLGSGGYPTVGASTDLDGFYRGWTAPGAYVSNNEAAQSNEEELARQAERIGFPEACRDSTVFDYDDGSYTGLAELWVGCGQDGAGQLMISTFVSDDHLLVGIQLLSEADIDAATRVLETFSFTGE